MISQVNPNPPAKLVKLSPPSISTEEDPNDGFGLNVDSSDEENVHNSVLTRHYRKKRKTSIPAPPNAASQPFSPSAFSLSPQDSFDVLSAPPDLNYGYSSGRRRKSNSSVPAGDIAARSRCYDYIHSAIDAVWAEFCISTSCAEDLRYQPQSPISDSEAIKPQVNNRLNKRSDSVSSEPKSQTLMKQKQKLQNAKTTLGQHVNSPDPHSSQFFWRVWDQVKYIAVEPVEGDEDEFDEVIDELEEGRLE